MSKKIAYIAGPVSGLDPTRVAERFLQLQTKLEAQGYQVINPVSKVEKLNLRRIMSGKQELKDTHPKHRRFIMAICLYQILKDADELHLMDGWQASSGAQAERQLALAIGLKIVEH